MKEAVQIFLVLAMEEDMFLQDFLLLCRGIIHRVRSSRSKRVNYLEMTFTNLGTNNGSSYTGI